MRKFQDQATLLQGACAMTLWETARNYVSIFFADIWWGMMVHQGQPLESIDGQPLESISYTTKFQLFE